MIQKDTQRTLADQLFHPEKQNTRTAAFLAKMETVFDWKPLVRIASELNQSGQGSMIGKIFGLFTVMKTMGKEVSQSALVTSFCEMMLLSGYAFQEYIVWKPLDEKTLEATLTDGGMSVSVVFHFDDEGLFSYFETDDRFFDNGQNNYSKEKFKAVMDSYKKAGEMYYPENVRVQWCLEDGDYDYFKGTIEEIRYNTE